MEPIQATPSPENPWDLTREQPEAYADWQYEVRNGDTLRGFAEWYAEREVTP